MPTAPLLSVALVYTKIIVLSKKLFYKKIFNFFLHSVKTHYIHKKFFIEISALKIKDKKVPVIYS